MLRRALCLALLLTTPALAAPTPAAKSGPYTIRLLAGELTPAAGVTASTLTKLAAKGRAVGEGKVHALVQLHRIPTEAEKRQLAEQGLELGPYLSGRAWLAALPAVRAGEVLLRREVRWATPWDASRKLHPRLAAGPAASLDPRRPERAVVFVYLHHDVALETAKDLAAALDAEIATRVAGLHGVLLNLPAGRLGALAEREEVRFITEAPMALSANNNGVRSLMRVNPLQASPYGLSGVGVRMMVYDEGWVDEDHPAFAGPRGTSRVSLIDEPNPERDHSTHVAGTAGASGDGSPLLLGRGVAPAIRILSAAPDYDGITLPFVTFEYDMEEDYLLATGEPHRADLATNSLGSNLAWWPTPWCEAEGTYGTTAELIDGIVRGDHPEIGRPLPVTWSAGNERGYAQCGTAFDTIAPPACAKNPIHVGAVNSDGGAMTSFSSWGPCDDGRLKPTVVAPGCETGAVNGDDGIYSSLVGGIYGSHAWVDGVLTPVCGTSMATPAVAGTLALVIEDWRDLGHGGAGEQPLPALLKAMLIQTSHDRGAHGPDFLYGYGLVDAKALIDLLRADDGVVGNGGGPEWGRGEVTHEGEVLYEVVVPASTARLVASLAWDDPASGPETLGELVNDLTLELVAPDGTLHRAWVLDPKEGKRHKPATHGDNTLDNQEQVEVIAPVEGTWTLRVRGTDVPSGAQTYGLAWSAERVNVIEQLCVAWSDNFSGRTSEWTFEDGAEVAKAPDSTIQNWNQALRFTGSGAATRTVTVSVDAGRAEWSYRFWVESQEQYPYVEEDRLRAEARDHFTGEVLAVAEHHNAGWPQKVWMETAHLDLSDFDGQTLDLVFHATMDSTYPTTFWVDDFSFETCPTTLPTPLP
ncbi:MAG TPA: S8 family serine peptidase [Thermoanaerobaculia bacterium]|nr:S8 family serine peptidase [Thermoanaerobaculia bacterium]